MSIACELPVWLRSVELPTTSMLSPTLGITDPPPASTSSKLFASAAHGAISASAAKRNAFMMSSLFYRTVRGAYTFGCPRGVTDSRQLEYAFDVLFIELFPIGFADRQLVRDFYLLRHELVRIVHRVHHALDAEHRDAELDRRRPLHAARRHPDVRLEVFAGLLAQFL